MNLTELDIEFLAQKGISAEEVKDQMVKISKGVNVPNIIRTASIDDGILIYNDSEKENYINRWESYLSKKSSVVHFIPASGRANRFLRNLNNFLKSDKTEPTTNFEKNFFKHLPSFAFYNELNKFFMALDKKDVQELLEEGQYKRIVDYMLTEKGLNYLKYPVSMFKFHTDKSKRFVSIQKYLPKKIQKYYASFEDTRTPIQETLIECAMLSGKNKEVNVCFTVNDEHKEMIQDYIRDFKLPIEKKLGVNFSVILQTQSHATDAIMLTKTGAPCRNEHGNLVLKQAGHGALLENMNSLKNDLVFIKNIDNQSPDILKKQVVEYRKMMGGILINCQKSISKFLRLLDKGDVPDDQLIEIINFVENVLNVKRDKILLMAREEQYEYLRNKLNRPLRVCGMVKNEEEVGGMPCWVKNSDGTISLQIIDFYQITGNTEYEKLFISSTHFNPVDMVCYIADYKGRKFDLNKYSNPDEYMLLPKRSAGQEAIRLERAGLWNGGMSDWNTIFVEIPIKNFNPVKRINDLLRHEHQNT
ncbi:MAG: DUF4301 family protein [Paludibacteraceae bacterium]|nr:DUF4301 family protein [Paludibacteraceae bacterium]